MGSSGNQIIITLNNKFTAVRREARLGFSSYFGTCKDFKFFDKAVNVSSKLFQNAEPEETANPVAITVTHGPRFIISVEGGE